jgi:hypothetical protein
VEDFHSPGQAAADADVFALTGGQNEKGDVFFGACFLAVTIIPAHEAFALDAKVKHKALTASQKRILAEKRLITYRTSSKSIRNTGADRMLNPQPLPPGPDAYKSTKLKSIKFNRGSAVSLNPQPLPPGPPPDKLNAAFKNRGSAVSLNPQPLPPGPPPDKLNPALNRINSTDRLQNLQLDRRTTGVR